MPRRKKQQKKVSQADKGREILKETKEANVAAVQGYAIDEPVQYYDGGWRYGHVRELPVRGLHRGWARVEHPLTHRKVWVNGTSLRKLEHADEDSSLPRPLGAAVPLQ